MIYLLLMLFPSISFAENYFAEVDASNNVLRVIVAEQSFVDNMPGTWIKTSEDAIQGRTIASRGDTYDAAKQGFIPKKPYASWVLDEKTLKWKAPKDGPKDAVYVWDELKSDWVKPKKP